MKQEVSEQRPLLRPAERKPALLFPRLDRTEDAEVDDRLRSPVTTVARSRQTSQSGPFTAG
jgi:hypothetical protein